MRAETAPERSRAAKIAFGAIQALGMLLVARACEVFFHAAAVQALSGAPAPWWSSIPGWVALVWIAKRAAAAGWWRVEGAWTLGGATLVGGFVYVAWAGPEFALGWIVALLWSCVWPLARASLELMEPRDPASGAGAKDPK